MTGVTGNLREDRDVGKAAKIAESTQSPLKLIALFRQQQILQYAIRMPECVNGRIE